MWAFPHIILGVVEHLEPIVPLVDDLVDERASSHVVPIVAIVNFLHHLPSLLQTKATQIRVEVETGVGFFV